MDVVQACADAFARRDFIFVADFSDVSVCTTLFLSRIFQTFRFVRRYICRGRFSLHDSAATYLQDRISTIIDTTARTNGSFGLHVIFVVDLSDV